MALFLPTQPGARLARAPMPNGRRFQPRAAVDWVKTTDAEFFQGGETRPIMLFDGVCNLCNGGVRFVRDNDRNRRIRYISLQSESGRKLLQRSGRSPDDISSVVLVENDRSYIKSEAVLRIMEYLEMPFPQLALFLKIVPLMSNPQKSGKHAGSPSSEGRPITPPETHPKVGDQPEDLTGALLAVMKEFLLVQKEETALRKQIREEDVMRQQELDRIIAGNQRMESWRGPFYSTLPQKSSGKRPATQNVGEDDPVQQGRAKIQATAPQQKIIICHFCGKRGHGQRECRSRLHLCLGCGGNGHLATQCPRRRSVKQNPDGSTSLQGEKTKIQGTTSSQQLPQLKPPTCCFCGKRGHIQRDCRTRLHLCLACGDSRHLVAQCPNKRVTIKASNTPSRPSFLQPDVPGPCAQTVLIPQPPLSPRGVADAQQGCQSDRVLGQTMDQFNSNHEPKEGASTDTLEEYSEDIDPHALP